MTEKRDEPRVFKRDPILSEKDKQAIVDRLQVTDNNTGCQHCGGRDFAIFDKLGAVHIPGPSGEYYLAVIVSCKKCGHLSLYSGDILAPDILEVDGT